MHAQGKNVNPARWLSALRVAQGRRPAAMRRACLPRQFSSGKPDHS